MSASDLDKLSLGDLRTLLTVKRLASISRAARELRVTPSQVSKAVVRVESILRRKLLVRGRRGVSLSSEAVGLLPQLEHLYERLAHAIRGESPGSVVTIASPPYLQSSFLPFFARALSDLYVRGLEMAPALIRAHATDNVFDVALMLGATELPLGWESEHMGDLRLSLFATPDVALRLGPDPVSLDALRALPFISPVYLASGQFVPVDDGCPMPREERRPGSEVQSIGLALEVAAETGQLVFGPRLAARHFLEHGTLREIHVQGWLVEKPLYLLCHPERVLARVQKAIIGEIRTVLARARADFGAPSPLAFENLAHLGGKAAPVPFVHDQRRKNAESTPITQDGLDEHTSRGLVSHAVDRAQNPRHQLRRGQRGKKVG